MTTASSLRSAGSLLGDPPGALFLSTVLIRLSSVWSRKNRRTQANVLHLKHSPHSGFDVVQAPGGRVAMHRCMSQRVPPGPRAGRVPTVENPSERAPDPQGQRLIPMLLPSVYRIGSSNVSTRN